MQKLNVDAAIEIVCSILDITVPRVEHRQEGVINETTMACYNPESDTLTINDTIADADKLLAIAHEMRHKWQVENHEEEFFSDYVQLRDERNTNTYNLQLAEVDAQAFAAIIVETFAGLRPLFHGLDNKAKLAIKRRKSEIKDETLRRIKKAMEEEQ